MAGAVSNILAREYITVEELTAAAAKAGLDDEAQAKFAALIAPR